MTTVEFGETIYLNKYTEYSKDNLSDLFLRLTSEILKAKESGLSDVVVKFESTVEPYEDYPGDVAVTILGNRPPNKKELKELKEQKAIQELATKMGITFYEASVLDKLEKRNKVKLQ